MALPLQKTDSVPMSLMQTTWKSQLDPVLANPLTSARIIKNVSLIDGVTVVNHGLGQIQQGWFLVDAQGAATIYRSAPFNASTLTLTSSAAVTVNIAVF